MFNIAFEAATKADAKTDLAQRNADQPEPMGDEMLAAVGACIDALGGTGNIGVGIYGTADQITLSVARRA